VRFAANERDQPVELALPAGSRVTAARLEVAPEPDALAYPNPGMEEGNAKSVTGWYTAPFAPGSGPDTTTFHGSTRSLKLIGAGQPVNSYGPYWSLPDYVPPCANLPLNMGLWVKGVNVKDAKLGWANMSGNALAMAALPEGTYDWQHVEISGTAARLAHGTLQLLIHLGGGTLWLDDLTSLPPAGVRLAVGAGRTPVWPEGGTLDTAALAKALNQALAATPAGPDGRVRVPLWVHVESMGAVRVKGVEVKVE
jgi:hypothetical protein